MTPAERVALARSLRERGLQFYMAGMHVDRDTAIAKIRKSRQPGRRYSACMQESDE
ncbi:MAG TPA: hypothetical protein VF701_04655 [Thermoanaerobaculia bacterium]